MDCLQKFTESISYSQFDGKNGEALNYITEAGLISEAVVNSAEKNGVELEFEAKIDELVIPARFNYKIHDTDFVKLTVNDRQIESQESLVIFFVSSYFFSLQSIIR